MDCFHKAKLIFICHTIGAFPRRSVIATVPINIKANKEEYIEEIVYACEHFSLTTLRIDNKNIWSMDLKISDVLIRKSFNKISSMFAIT